MGRVPSGADTLRSVLGARLQRTWTCPSRAAAGRSLVCATLALAFWLVLPPSARAVELHRCGPNLSCATVAVPLDRSGSVPGTVNLRVVRRSSEREPRDGTVIALAGGPGESAVELLDDLTGDLAEVLDHRALVVFDARGVGQSDPITCPRPTDATGVSTCAEHLGPARAFYATADSVADLEAVREALGIERFSLSGVSYGTATALGYARAHPEHVQRLVLDSPVPFGGPSALELSSVAAMRRVLTSLCAGVCHGASPVQDLARALARYRARPPRGRSATFLDAFLYGLLLQSDEHPFLRASLPAAIHLAAQGELSALDRLGVAAAGLSLSGAAPAQPPPDVPAVPLATTCDDVAVPWAAPDPSATRDRVLAEVLQSVPAAAVTPFDRATILDESTAPVCVSWPEAGARAQDDSPPPAVPTLILSGRDDIRTPLEDAVDLAARLPDAELLNVGHAVLAQAAFDCPRNALTDFFAGRPVKRCEPDRPAMDPFTPALADVSTRYTGLAGTRGRVVAATVLTLRHDVGLLFDIGRRLGILRGTRHGAVTVSRKGGRDVATLHRVSYVKDVTLSGTLTSTGGQLAGALTVRLNGARYGLIATDGDGNLRGRVGGRPVRVLQQHRERIVAAAGIADLPTG